MDIGARRRSSAGASASARTSVDESAAQSDETADAKPDDETADRKPWRRILYEPQSYPDNHTDDSFLERLVLNGRVVPRRVRRVILDATTVSQQLAIVALKASVTALLLSGVFSAELVLLCDGVFLGTSALIVARTQENAARKILRGGPLTILALILLTPLFQTMTAAISDDTAFAASTLASVAHLLTHDYAFLNTHASRFGNAVSLGCAMFAASVSASRLKNSLAVFADVLLSTTLFVLFPFLRRFVRGFSDVAHATHVFFSHGLAIVAVAYAADDGASAGASSSAFACVFAYVFLVINVALLCPLWLVRMMRFKRQINGPWDEARPEEAALRKRPRRAAARADGRGFGF
jgi:phosphatidylinositol glycan class C protein